MAKKLIICLVAITIIFVLLFVFFKIIRIQDKILKNIYPIKYSEYVEKYSKDENIDKYMIYAIIKAESNFNPNVRSKSKAIGLMQLLEATAAERARTIDVQDVQESDLYDPETNIKLGTSYYSYLLKYYNGNNILALTAYNAGIGNVNEWIEYEIIKSDGSDVENIPFKETNNYVRKILKNYQMYIKLYN